MVVILMSLY